MSNAAILILGVGNPLRRDDGVGPAVIRRLSEQRERKGIPPGTDIIDGGTDGLGLIEYFRKYKKVILVDAVEMGMPPGSIKIFTPEEALFHSGTDSLSTHGFGIPELINLARELDILPELTIIGVQPETTQYGMELSKSVLSSVKKVCRLIT
jgi:hydrogenase maturation protease